MTQTDPQPRDQLDELAALNRRHRAIDQAHDNQVSASVALMDTALRALVERGGCERILRQNTHIIKTARGDTLSLTNTVWRIAEGERAPARGEEFAEPEPYQGEE